MSQRRGISGERNKKAVERKKFSPTVLEALADDVKSGRIPLKRFTLTDDEVTGLRAIIRYTGLISFHVQYTLHGEDGDARPYLKIGDYPGMKIEKARKIARTVHELAEMGIDPTAGLHERLIRELDEKGAKWRP
jgi:hypothetical protein